MQAIVASICIYATAGNSKLLLLLVSGVCNLCWTVQVEVVYQRWHWGATPLLCHLQYPLQVLYCTVLYCTVLYCAVLYNTVRAADRLRGDLLPLDLRHRGGQVHRHLLHQHPQLVHQVHGSAGMEHIQPFIARPNPRGGVGLVYAEWINVDCR